MENASTGQGQSLEIVDGILSVSIDTALNSIALQSLISHLGTRLGKTLSWQAPNREAVLRAQAERQKVFPVQCEILGE